MEKYLYQLMAKGHKKQIYGESEIVWDVAFYSPVKHTYAKDEETARITIRQQLKTKWIGFKLKGIAE